MTHRVTDIIIYPIKGMAGISVEKAQAFAEGFQYDRRWMLIDQDLKFVTQRTKPIIALFETSLHNDQVGIRYRDQSFIFSSHDVIDEVIHTKVWDDHAITQAVSREADEWFSDLLDQKVKLVKLASQDSRKHHSSATNKSYPVNLADGYPYLVIGDESLRMLNEKLEVKVPMNRFRPNIVVTTSTAHEEDRWQAFKLGSTSFTNIKPCSRCTVVTIDQATAQVNNETLRVLNTYRKENNSVLFGTNVVCKVPGVVAVGDKVEFL